MSDPLDRAVDARIDAYRPDLVPPFEAIQDRKRTRDRRRGITAAAATALAVAGIAFVPAALGGGGMAPAPVAGDPPPAEKLAFHIKATDTKTVLAGGEANGEAISRCAQLPGLSNTGALFSYPGQYTGLVAAEDADALTDCVEAVPGWAVTFTRVADAAAFKTYTVQPSVRTVRNPRAEEERDACFALPGVGAVGQGESMPVIYKVEVVAASVKAFEECISQVVGLYVPELDPTANDAAVGGLVWTGVTVCRLTGQGEQDCQFFGEQEAEALDAALGTATPAPADQVYCAAAGPAYTVAFDPGRTVRLAPATVRVGCGPMEKGGQDLLLPEPAQRLVQQVHADAGTGPSANAFIDRCLGTSASTAGEAGGYLGKTEAQAEALAADTGATLRVFGRDGTCLGGTRDLRNDRVNVLLVRDRVIWAGRF